MTVPGHAPVGLAIKHYGVMAGVVVLSLIALRAVWRNHRFVTGAPARVWAGCVMALVMMMGLYRWRPALEGHGLLFARMASDYWSIDFVGELSVLLRRVFPSALAYLLGFRESSYVWFWYGAYAATVWLAVRLLVARGLFALECVALLASSMLGVALLVPGYGDVVVLALALYAWQNRLWRVEKLAFFLMALSTHEACAIVCFAGLLLVPDRAQRREWLWVLAVGIALDVTAVAAVRWLDGGQRLGQTVYVGQRAAWDWVFMRPWGTLLGVLCAYKLYWAVVGARAHRHLRGHAALVLLSLPFVFLATDTPRVVAFTSLAFLVLAAEVVSQWRLPTRRAVAVANLALPGIYVAANCELFISPGLYWYGVNWLQTHGQWWLPWVR